MEVLFSADDRKIFYRLLHSIDKNRYATRNDGSSLLHLCLSHRTSAFDSFIDPNCKWVMSKELFFNIKCLVSDIPVCVLFALFWHTVLTLTRLTLYKIPLCMYLSLIRGFVTRLYCNFYVMLVLI